MPSAMSACGIRTIPKRYLLSRSRAPELVTPDDFIEYDLNSQPQRDPGVGQYSERVIHGEIYKARPEVNSVCHHHCPAFMPLLATGTDYMPIFHLGAVGGIRPPFWDQRDEFGDTNMLVVKPEEGASLARALGKHWMVLMMRHGVTVAGTSVRDCVFRSVFSARNAEYQVRAHDHRVRHRHAFTGRNEVGGPDQLPRPRASHARGNIGRCGSPRPADLGLLLSANRAKSAGLRPPKTSAPKRKPKKRALTLRFSRPEAGVECCP